MWLRFFWYSKLCIFETTLKKKEKKLFSIFPLGCYKYLIKETPFVVHFLYLRNIYMSLGHYRHYLYINSTKKHYMGNGLSQLHCGLFMKIIKKLFTFFFLSRKQYPP